MRDASGHVTYVTGSHAVILEELSHSLHFTYMIYIIVIENQTLF